MTPEHLEKSESWVSYIIGIAGIVLPNIMTFATDLLHFITVAGGAGIVIFRLIHDYRNYKKEK
jgi:hypothetical protein